MPDNNGNNGTPNNGSATNNETSQLYTDRRSAQSGRTEMQILESIERQLGQIVQNGGNINNMSASNARNQYGGKQGSTFYQDLNIGRIGRRGNYRDFTQAFEKELFDNLLGREFKQSMHELRDKLARDLGVEVGELPKKLGELAGKQLSTKIKNSEIGKAILNPITKYRDNLLQQIKDAYDRGSQASRLEGMYRTGQRTGSAQMNDISDVVNPQADLISRVGSLAQQAAGTEGALGGLSEVLSTVVTPKMLATGAATMGLSLAADGVTYVLKKNLKPSLDEFKKLLGEVSKTWNRYQTSRDKNLENSRKRLEEDVRSMVETPFKILEDAAQRWYDTWDNTLRNITATQGYTKDQVQQLYGNFVERLRTEGLTDVIGANDIVNNLSNVLSAGLQGAAAEEFAYIATKLNAAIPTQDFFNYAETYELVASNALSNGKTLDEALTIANSELETFANNLLYAGRELSSGFATGLKGAETLFQKAEQIAQAGRFGSGAQLGATLSSIAAVTGAVAPDLASSIVDAVYNAAVGGNASEIVALRSLAGINASNTEFLNALMTDPQTVFGDIFDKLYQYQNMANGAYMEVAEGLSSIFGLSSDSLSRIDFSQVANAVRASSSPTSALSQNMKLLASGQTTTNAELMRLREVNQYMVDEGLAYVLDNEVTREVTKHMWDEQIASELMEATYGVELTGQALVFLEKLAGGINNIINIVNPRAWVNKGQELQVSTEQEKALKSDIARMIELGRVGIGNTKAYQQLTTYGKNLGITGNYLELLGGMSSYRDTYNDILSIRNQGSKSSVFGFSGYDNNTILGLMGTYIDTTQAQNQKLQEIFDTGAFQKTVGILTKYNTPEYTPGAVASLRMGVHDAMSAISDNLNTLILEQSSILNGPTSAYNWSMVGKSALSRYTPIDYDRGGVAVALSNIEDAAQNNSRLMSNLQNMLDSMESFYEADESRTYEDFVKTAKTFGIANYEEALEKGGLTTATVENRYQALQAQSGAKAELERRSKEEKYWEDNILQLTTSNTWLESINSTATNIFNIFDDFVNAWKDYFIEHTVYNSAYTRDAVQKVLNEERDSSETAIYALADALTQNDIGLLMDPTLQTNALLAQILKVANAILNQQGTGAGGISLPDTLAGLSLGIINQ